MWETHTSLSQYVSTTIYTLGSINHVLLAKTVWEKLYEQNCVFKITVFKIFINNYCFFVCHIPSACCLTTQVRNCPSPPHPVIQNARKHKPTTCWMFTAVDYNVSKLIPRANVILMLISYQTGLGIALRGNYALNRISCAWPFRAVGFIYEFFLNKTYPHRQPIPPPHLTPPPPHTNPSTPPLLVPEKLGC